MFCFFFPLNNVLNSQFPRQFRWVESWNILNIFGFWALVPMKSHSARLQTTVRYAVNSDFDLSLRLSRYHTIVLAVLEVERYVVAWECTISELGGRTTTSVTLRLDERPIENQPIKKLKNSKNSKNWDQDILDMNTTADFETFKRFRWKLGKDFVANYR